MSASRTNAHGQPVGAPVSGVFPVPRPERVPMEGRVVRLEPADPTLHGAELFSAFSGDADGRGWTYMPYGPFPDEAAFTRWMEETCGGEDPVFFAIRDPATGRALGLASYLRIDPQAGSVEVGHIRYSPALQGTRGATEAMALMMGHAFALGYRRYEWKCDALNAASRRAAERLGFVYEGTFRQATHYKGRNRDTAWYSVIDGEWPRVRDGFADWLAPENFDADGRQLRRLEECRGG